MWITIFQQLSTLIKNINTLFVCPISKAFSIITGRVLNVYSILAIVHACPYVSIMKNQYYMLTTVECKHAIKIKLPAGFNYQLKYYEFHFSFHEIFFNYHTNWRCSNYRPAKEKNLMRFKCAYKLSSFVKSQTSLRI
jgi:hypothetical protein